MKHVGCNCCRWSIATSSLKQLFDEGWRLVVRFILQDMTPAVEMRWLCSTCSSADVHVQRVCHPGACPKEQELFDMQPPTGRDPYPSLEASDGDPRNSDRVKPYCGRCRGGDPALDDDVVHANPGVLQ